MLLAGWHAPLAFAEPSITMPYLVATLLSQIVTNWVYYNARESALLAILYHTAANTMGRYFAPMLSGPDLIDYFWLLAAVNAVAAIIVVTSDWKTWRSRQPAVPASVEVVPGIS